MERYILQPVKSIVLLILNSEDPGESLVQSDINCVQMPKLLSAMHVGICRSANTDESAVTENVKKAKPTIYSLVSAPHLYESMFC